MAVGSVATLQEYTIKAKYRTKCLKTTIGAVLTLESITGIIC